MSLMLFECGTSRSLGRAEAFGAQTEQELPGLFDMPLGPALDKALGSSVSEDFLVSRRLFHGLHSIQEFLDEFIGIA